MSKRAPTGGSIFEHGSNESRTFNEYMLGPDLPHDKDKRAKCIEHIEGGAAAKLASDFQKHGGLHYPEANEPQEITTRFTCRGLSCVFRDCGLKIVQYDSNGIEISRMSG